MMNVKKNNPRFTRKGFLKTKSLLKEWYGESLGTTECLKYLPKESKIADAVDLVLSKKMGYTQTNLMKLKKAWVSIVGKHIAQVAIPTKLDSRILTIEVDNSSWIMELKFQSKIIEKKIEEHFKKKIFYKMMFVLKKNR